MGRAMIIICAGVLVAFGYVSYGSNQQARQVVGTNAAYAEYVTAKNSAHTVIQMAMNEMNVDPDWRDSYGEGTPWTRQVDGREVKLYIDVIYEETDPNLYFNPDTIRVVSTATYYDPVSDKEKEARVISVYLTSAIDEYVPDFEAALTVATENANISASGSASISGTEASGTCPDSPAITVKSDDMQDEAESGTSSIDVEGDISVNPDLSYNPTDQMIARLRDQPGVQLIEGNYKGDFGTAENPGVFFVESAAKLTGGIPDGYGILVIRSAGDLILEDEDGARLDLAGNFKFNGLVVFENAYTLKGRGTPQINGSVLIGNTEDYDGDINIDLGGNIHLQYDCEAERYAKMAASQLIQNNRYRRISTFE